MRSGSAFFRENIYLHATNILDLKQKMTSLNVNLANFVIGLGYTTLNIHEIWLRLFRGEHLLYIRAKMTSFVNSHD